MDTFKLDESTSQPPLRNCGNCAYRYPERMPQQLMPSLVCHRFPPQMVVVPAQGGALQFMAVFPVVQPQQFCHSHDLRSDESVAVVEPDGCGRCGTPGHHEPDCPNGR